MRSPRALVLATLLVAASLTGCLGLTGDGGDEAGEDLSPDSARVPDDPESGPAAGEAGNLTRLAFPTGSATNTTVWANGSFSPERTCYVSGCVTGSAVEQVVVEDELPEGLPVQVTATLTYEASAPALFDEHLDLGMFSEEATFYSFEGEEEVGRDVVEATVLGGSGPVTVQVFYEWPTGSEPEASYTLEISIASDPTVASPGVPVAVDLGPGEHLQAAAVGEGPAAMDLRGPDDARIERVSAEDGGASLTVPDEAGAGEYVLVVPSSSSPLRVATNGSAETMRPLATAFAAGDLNEVRPGEPVEVSFDLDKPPMNVGAYFTQSQPAGTSATQGTVTVEAPGGTVLDGSFGCGICTSLSYYASAWTSTADPALTPGTYTLTYEPGAEAGYGVGHFVVTYER